MLNQYFGQFLLNKAILTPDQLYDVLSYERSVHVKLGVLAINAGFMTAAQVEEVHELQKTMDKRFGEIAIQQGYITSAQLEDLLDAQKQRHLNLSQAIIDRGYLTLSELETALEGYKQENRLSADQLQAIQQANFDEIVRMFLDFSKAGPNSDVYYSYVALTLRNMIRFLNEQPTIAKDMPLGEKAHGWMASQAIVGEVKLFTGLIMDEKVLLEIGRRYTGEELTEVDELAKDCLAEFLNVSNGIFNVNMSENGLELDMKPQEVQKDVDVSEIRNGFRIPVMLSFGNLEIVVAVED